MVYSKYEQLPRAVRRAYKRMVNSADPNRRPKGVRVVTYEIVMKEYEALRRVRVTS